MCIHNSSPMVSKQRKYLVNLPECISVQLDSAFRHIKFWDGRWSDERQTAEKQNSTNAPSAPSPKNAHSRALIKCPGTVQNFHWSSAVVFKFTGVNNVIDIISIVGSTKYINIWKSLQLLALRSKQAAVRLRVSASIGLTAPSGP